MANRELTRKVRIPSPDAARWWRLWACAFAAFFVLNGCIAYATEDAPDGVRDVLAIVFLLGYTGIIGGAFVLGVKLMQHFSLVFTVYWTQPKEIGPALIRLWYRQIGMVACLRASAFTGLVVSGPLALIWLIRWVSSKLDPTTYVIPLPWTLAYILFAGIGFAALPFLGNYLDMVFSSKTIGFDKEWMGYLHARPGRALWRYGQIAEVRFESLRVGEREFRLMVVTPREGHEVAFGLSDEVNEGQIAGILADKGVEVVEEA